MENKDIKNNIIIDLRETEETIDILIKMKKLTMGILSEIKKNFAEILNQCEENGSKDHDLNELLYIIKTKLNTFDN